MKKLIYLFAFLFLFISTPAVAWMSPVIAGGGVPVAGGGECTTANDSILYTRLSTSSDYSAASSYFASTFTLSVESDITEYIVRQCGPGSSADVSMSIYTDDGGEPGTKINGTEIIINLDTISVCDTPGNTVYTLAATKEGLASGTYWLVCYQSSSSVGTYYRAEAGDVICYSDDAITWSCEYTDYTIEFDVMGCE